MEPLLLFSNLAELEAVLKQAGPDAKLYLGCDSEAMKLRVPAKVDEKKRASGKVKQLYENVWHADYTVVIAIHHREKHVDHQGNVTYTGKGSRILGEVVRERLYDQDRRKPRLRLMNEAYKVADAFIRLKPLIENHDLEIHLDINPKVEFNSSIVVKEAAAYVRGMTQVEPMVKNRAFAASFAADRFKEIANVARVKKGVVRAGVKKV